MSFLLIPVAAAWVYWVLVCASLACFFRRRTPDAAFQPSVSLIKPLCGLEPRLYENLATACAQNYPDYEVIFALQRPDDPALAVAERLRAERTSCNIRIVLDEESVGPNGRLANIHNAVQRARGEVLVFSDSDMHLEPDYLSAIVAPLADPKVGVSCTAYRAWRPRNIFEALELLSLNAEFVPAMIFAVTTGSSLACPGASQALRRETLERVGGLAPLGHYLVEDFELGRRVLRAGCRVHFVAYVAPTGIDALSARAWWRHQVYWDQNTRAASPVGFFFTLLVRGVPFAFLYAAVEQGVQGLVLLGVTLLIRMGTGAANAALLRDRDGLRWLCLLPLRDLLGLAVWAASFVQRNIYWRGRQFALDGNRMVEVA